LSHIAPLTLRFFTLLAPVVTPEHFPRYKLPQILGPIFIQVALVPFGYPAVDNLYNLNWQPYTDIHHSLTLTTH
jgi:hypothetical protein